MGSIVSLRDYAASKQRGLQGRRGALGLLLGLYHRFGGLLREVGKFGIVGVTAALIDIGGFNFLAYVVGLGPLTSKTLSMFVATTAAYLGSRYWTFRQRTGSTPAREYFLFFVMNGIGLLIQLLCLGFTVYTLRLDGPLAVNISGNVIGLTLATAFRYWAYKRWVFLPPGGPKVVPHTGLPVAPEKAGDSPAASADSPRNDSGTGLREAR